jgi:hypothetical protein
MREARFRTDQKKETKIKQIRRRGSKREDKESRTKFTRRIKEAASAKLFPVIVICVDAVLSE